MMDYEFDIKKYFESREVKYYLPGVKNVSHGWINIQCPYCYDKSWHLGINEKSSIFHCYICGEKGHLTKLISKLEKTSFKNAEQILQDFKNLSFESESLEIDFNKTISLPKTEDLFPLLHYKYLYNRGFDPDFLINKYQLKATNNLGKWKFRIIIPYFLNNKLVTWSGRDVTNKSPLRYLFASEDESIISAKKILYNFDTVKDKCIIVEGPTDTWVFENYPAIAVSGKEFTTEQISLIAKKRLKKVLIVFDSDDNDDNLKISSGEKLANQISGIVKKVELVELSEDDPASLPANEILQIEDLLK
jgi:DNA primase